MATKNASSMKFWAVLIGGGFLILLLGSFTWYMTPRSGTMMVFPNGTRAMMGGGTTASLGEALAPGAPMMDFTYSKDAAGNLAMPPSPSPIPPVVSGGDTAATATPRIIKNAQLSLEVDSSRSSAEMVANVAKNENGFVESSNIVENTDGTVSAYVTIRVPEEKFDDTISALTGLALRVTTQTVTGQDVTEQYTDLEARLKAAQAEEAQYLAILNKATSVQDILAVTQYLTQVRSEIESLQGQIKYLGNQTTYSTISVSLTEQANLKVPAGKFDLIRDMKQAGQAVILLGQAFLTFAVWFIIIGGAMAIPTAIVVYLIYLLVRKLMSR